MVKTALRERQARLDRKVQQVPLAHKVYQDRKGIRVLREWMVTMAQSVLKAPLVQ